jgi:hypothetical protein
MNYFEENSAATSDAPRILFFDNGFFRALLKGDFQHHLANLDSDLSVAIKLPFRPWRTPFSFMEWIGLDSKSLPKPQPFNPASVSGTDFIVPAYRHYEKHYAIISELDRENLENLAATQRDYVCPEMVGIWDSAMGGIFGERDVSGWLRFAMSFDAVHKLEVSRGYRRDYWSDLIAGVFFEPDPRVRNLSKFRLAYRMWIQTMEKLNYPGASPEMLKCIKEAHRLLTLGNWKDYLDSDLVHVAAYGVEDSGETRHRTHCLTCDDPEVLIMRIRLYKGLLSYVRKLYGKEADADGFPPDFDSSHNGEVFCFDLQGNLVRKIDVVSETPALAFLGEPA